MSYKRNREDGFSMIEMLIAILILAIGLLGLAELQISAMRSNAKSGSIVAASSIGQLVVEEVMAVNSKSNPLYALLTTSTVNYTDWPLGASEILAGLGEYTVQYKSTPDYPPGSDSGVTLVEIRVSPQVTTSNSSKPIDVLAMKDTRRIYND
ncbi:MAG: prepilin-type N-terminal cleavage/methylation domain-containing protein [Deltaproteobacteria bacterium]|jgi:prepilin-type N-terminal cleavage/methylation domain-containing protein|nr:prepilin-type N-terminal cleavage/methylation domain-containing protein [Deltaproteobacteria bacterium]